jgi:Ca2+-binding RTX toxin-like protein
MGATMATIIDRSLGNVSNVADQGSMTLNGLVAIETVRIGTQTFVYATGELDDGVSVFSMNENGALTFLRSYSDTPTTALNGASSLLSVVLGGQTYLYVAGYADRGVSAFRVAADGSLVLVQSVFDDPVLELNGPLGRMSTVQVGGSTFLITSGFSDAGISVFSLAANGQMTNVFNVADAQSSSYRLNGAYDTVTTTIAGNAYVFVAGAGESGITSFRVGADGALTFVESVVDNATLRLAGIRNLAVGVMETTTFLFAAGRADDGVSVFTIATDGFLANVFNLADSAALGLNGAREITTFRIDGQLYISVSGEVDDAISYFQVNVDGSLVEMETILDNAILEMNVNISNTFVEINGRGFIITGGNADDGLSVFEIGGGNSVLNGTADADTIYGLGGNDQLLGGAQNDTLYGGAGDDLLNGGAGNDRMEGGTGNDNYIVAAVGDVAIELPGQGTDTVTTYIENYTLGVNFERLVMGSALIKATGNAVANTIIGNALANQLYGLGGNDYITAAAGNDFIDGGAGNDTMLGGLGNDIFVIGSVTDRAVEYSGQGTDTANVNVNDYRLDANVERMVMSSAVYRAYGNDLANTITAGTNANAIFGLGGQDYISAGGGNDVLVGGAGKDTLVGGAGNDIFRYGAVSESPQGANLRDTISDFARGSDRIDLAGIDANSSVAGNQAFTFVGTGAFTGASGQLRYGVFGTTAVVEADINGDRVADLQIAVNNIAALSGADFIL